MRKETIGLIVASLRDKPEDWRLLRGEGHGLPTADPWLAHKHGVQIRVGDGIEFLTVEINGIRYGGFVLDPIAWLTPWRWRISRAALPVWVGLVKQAAPDMDDLIEKALLDD